MWLKETFKNRLIIGLCVLTLSSCSENLCYYDGCILREIDIENQVIYLKNLEEEEFKVFVSSYDLNMVINNYRIGDVLNCLELVEVCNFEGCLIKKINKTEIEVECKGRREGISLHGEYLKIFCEKYRAGDVIECNISPKENEYKELILPDVK